MTTTALKTKIRKVENKISSVTGLVTTEVLNAKLVEVENKIPDHAKYITKPEFNKFTTTIIDTKLKQVNLTKKSWP